MWVTVGLTTKAHAVSALKAVTHVVVSMKTKLPFIACCIQPGNYVTITPKSSALKTSSVKDLLRVQI